MGDILNIAQIIMSSAENGLERNAHNVANMRTSGYKKAVNFQDILPVQIRNIDSESTFTDPQNRTQVDLPYVAHDLSQGKLQNTGNPYDLAVSGPGFIKVRAGDEYFYTRAGQLSRDDEGRLALMDTLIVQGDSGDIVFGEGALEILDDGLVLKDGLPVDIIPLFMADDGLVEPVSGSLFTIDNAISAREDAILRQGYIESSNVNMTQEMTGMMENMRMAETGSQLVRVYDELLGKAVDTFGQ